MSRVFDQLKLPEMQSEPVKAGREPASQRVTQEEQLHLVTAERGEQDRQLRIDELANQARLHVAAIERAHKRTAEEVLLSEKHSLRLAEEVRLELLSRERAEAEQAERGALVARIEAERQLAAQLEVRLEQEKIERAQAAQRAAQEEQLRRVIAEREQHETRLQAEENAALMRQHEAAIEESRKLAADETQQAERLAAQLREEARLEALVRERTLAEEEERSALASRIEAERQLTAQIEMRVEQEKIERALSSKKALHEEQLRIAAATREAQERQLRIEESAAQAASHEAAIEEARKRSAEEIRRAEELAERLAEEARLETLARERTQIEQYERASLAARIEAERRLAAQIEARIEQERLELEQILLREANEEKLRLATAERESLERRLQVEEMAAITKSQRYESSFETANKHGAGNIRGTEQPPARVVEQLRLKAETLKQPVKELTPGITPERIKPPSHSRSDKPLERGSSIRTALAGLNLRYTGYLAVILVVTGIVFFMAVGSGKIDKQSVAVTVQPEEQTVPAKVKTNPPIPETFPTAPLAPQVKATVSALPVVKPSPVQDGNPIATSTPETKATVTQAPKNSVASDRSDQIDHAAKSQQRGETEILRAIKHWADAWSRRDAEAYLSFYAVDFNPPEGMQRPAWEEQRKSRLSKYQSIKVTLKNMKISYLGGNTASASFAQYFRADNHMEIRTQKELGLKYTQGRWLIVSENNS